ncbi:MAG: disulfide bond formation protein B [Acidimicrobiales bacterium]|nr:disulfide bond formation protein B [Acidimicrobiales bacterium]
MSTDQMSTFFALLALGALVLGPVMLVATFALRRDDRRIGLQPLLVPLAFVVAATAMLGSLYYSERAHYTPCEFCWYQRICMYPLAGILLIAAIRRDRRIGLYGLPLAIAGVCLSIYHYQLQLFPDQGSSCDTTAPCTFQWVDQFGFMSIPFMAGCGFVAIIGLLTASLVWDLDDAKNTTAASTDGGGEDEGDESRSSDLPEGVLA